MDDKQKKILKYVVAVLVVIIVIVLIVLIVYFSTNTVQLVKITGRFGQIVDQVQFINSTGTMMSSFGNSTGGSPFTVSAPAGAYIKSFVMYPSSSLPTAYSPSKYGVCAIGPFTFSDGTVNKTVYGSPSVCTGSSVTYTVPPSS
jgi:hypothetical protein